MKIRQRAFTLIELLMAFTIFTIIAAAVYSSLNSGIKFYSQGNRIIEEQQKLRMFFETISQDLRNSVDYAPYFQPDWQANQIVFPALVNIFEQGVMAKQLAKLKYSLDNGKLTRRFAGVKQGFNEEQAPEEVLLEGVKELNFEYCYQSLSFDSDYQWVSRWDSQGQEANIPRGIKIIISLAQNGSANVETFTKTVFIPQGELGAAISG